MSTLAALPPASEGTDFDLSPTQGAYDSTSPPPLTPSESDLAPASDTDTSTETPTCPLCPYYSSSLPQLAHHISTSHSSHDASQSLLTSLGLARCHDCTHVFVGGVAHMCLVDRTARSSCPVQACPCTFKSGKALRGHLRGHHNSEVLDPLALDKVGIFQCPACLKFYSAKTASHKCVPLRKSDSKSEHRLPPAEPAPQPEDVCKYTWLFGEPTSDNYRWLFLPLLLCAFGRLDHGGLAQVAVGNDKWSRICSAFKSGFAKFPSCSFEDLPAAPSSVDSLFEPDSIKIVHVLLNPDKNPEDIQCGWPGRTGIGGASPGKATGTRALEIPWTTPRYIELSKISSVKPTEKMFKLSIRASERFCVQQGRRAVCKHNKTMLGMVDLRKTSLVASESLLK